MDRREFLTRGWRRAADAAGSRRGRGWIRPPFALDEAAFLTKCTGCGDCVSACPHDVIFPLTARAGLRAEGTPALDLLSRGCHLCEDWPCVTACAPGALQIAGDAEDTPPEPPRLASAEIDTGACIAHQGPECGACAHACPVPGALRWDGPKPVIDAGACTGCALCREACIVSPKAIRISEYREKEEARERA
ncbi:MAG: 4Fe-4S dicluster domain-containing protein [Paracoccaceae bacterium]